MYRNNTSKIGSISPVSAYSIIELEIMIASTPWVFIFWSLYMISKAVFFVCAFMHPLCVLQHDNLIQNPMLSFYCIYQTILQKSKLSPSQYIAKKHPYQASSFRYLNFHMDSTNPFVLILAGRRTYRYDCA